MATRVGSLLISLALESGAFNSGLVESERKLKASVRRIQQTGKQMQDFGARLSLAVSAPLIALAAKSVAGLKDQMQAVAQVEAAIKSMGNAAGRTSAELQKTADALEMNSLFDADVILKQVTANLLTFGNVAGEQFDRAQQAAIDMATRLGGEPQAAAIQLGKALQDPIHGLAALGKTGTINQDWLAANKARIAGMVAEGKLAQVQGEILSQVEMQYGGAAAAAANTDPWRKATVAINQAMDAIGAAILPAIKPATEAIVKLANAFSALPPSVQQTVVVAGALAAALGPVLFGLGSLVKLAAPIVGVLGPVLSSGGLLAAGEVALSGLAAALGPVLVPLGALAALGAVVYANWDKIAPVLAELWQGIQQALGPPFQAVMDKARAAFAEIGSSELVSALITLAQRIGNIGLVVLKALGGALPGVIRAFAALIAGAFNVVIDVARIVVDLLSGDFSGAWEAAKDLVADVGRAIIGIVSGLVSAVIGLIGGMVRGIGDWMQGKLGAIFDWVGKKIDAVKGYFFGLYDAVVGHSYIPDMVDGIAQHMARLGAVMVDPAQRATKATGEAFRTLAGDVQSLLERLFPKAAALAQYRADLALIDRGEATGAIDQRTADSARAALRGELGSATARQKGDNPILSVAAGAKPLADVQGIMDSFTRTMQGAAQKTQVQSVSIVKSVGDMAQGVLDKLKGLTDAIRGGDFLDILGGVLDLVLQLGSVGAFGKTIQANINSAGSIPGRAIGGPVTMGSPYMVGERGPELFVPGASGRIVPNNALGGGAVVNNYYTLPSDEFWRRVDGRVATAAPAIVSAASRVTQSEIAGRNYRRAG